MSIERFREKLAQIKPDIMALLGSFSMGISIYFIVFEKLFQIKLKGFPDRSIGITVLSGFDANARTFYYCLAIFLTIILILAFSLLLTWLNRLVRKNSVFIHAAAIQSSQFILSVFALFLTCYAIFKGNKELLKIAGTLLAMVGFLYFYLLLTLQTFKYKPAIFSYYRDYSLVVFSMTLSFALLFAGWAFAHLPLTITRYHLLFFFCSSMAMVYTYPRLLFLFGYSPDRVRPMHLMAAIPLAFIPASIPLSNEIQYTISGLCDIQPEKFARIIIGSIFLVSLLLFLIMQVWKPIKIRTSFALHYLIFPALIVGFFLFGAVGGILKFKVFDLFHDGERMIITQQLFSFGRIPFVDIIPTHGMMDFFGQSVYSAVNGYHGPEMFLWRWIPFLIGGVLLFFIMARLVSPLFSFLLFLIAPEIILLNGSYRLCLAMVFVVMWIARKPSFRRYLVLWITIVILFFWRYDFGIISGMATLCVIPGIYFLKTGSQLSLSSFVKSFYPLILSFLVVSSCTLLLYVAILWLNGYNPVEILVQFYYYFKIQVPTQTVVMAFDNDSVLFFIEYIVTPMISVSYIIYYLYSVLIRNTEFKRIQLGLVWLAIFGIIISMRMIQRHTLSEGFNPMFSTFLLCTAPFYFPGIRRFGQIILFLLIFLVYLLLISTGQSRDSVKTMNPVHVPDGKLYNFFSLPPNGSRVVIRDSSQFKKFTRFCDSYLARNQTFFDFSNAPLLYVFTNRLFPAHIIPNLFHAADPIEDYLIRRLRKYLENGQMPLVVFKQNSNWDFVDGIPQPIRSYRIAEFIYQNYLPFAVVDKYEIWRARSSEMVLKEPPRVSVPFRNVAEIKVSEAKIQSYSSDSIVIQSNSTGPVILNLLDFGDRGFEMIPSQTVMIRLKYSCDRGGPMQLFYSINGSKFGKKLSTVVEMHSGQGVYEHVIILPPVKESSLLTGLRIDPPNGSRLCLYRPAISMSEFYAIDRTAPQDFDLKKLPYVWANFDDKHAATETEILDDQRVNDSLIPVNEMRTIQIGQDPDKGSGNYLHFFISAKESGSVAITYGGHEQSTIRFDLEPSGKVEQYLVRVSSQWAWMNDHIDKIEVRPSVPIVLGRMVVRKGD